MWFASTCFSSRTRSADRSSSNRQASVKNRLANACNRNGNTVSRRAAKKTIPNDLKATFAINDAGEPADEEHLFVHAGIIPIDPAYGEIDPAYCAVAKERLAKAELACVKQKET